MHVSLAEALEVRGGPLQEEEVWAVLSQSAESLQELFHKGTDTRDQACRACFRETVLHSHKTEFTLLCLANVVMSSLSFFFEQPPLEIRLLNYYLFFGFLHGNDGLPSLHT